MLQDLKCWKTFKKIIHASIQISSVFQLSLNNSTLAQTAKLGWFIKNEFYKETTLQRVSLKSIVPFLFLTINSRSRTFLLNNVIWSSFKRKSFLITCLRDILYHRFYFLRERQHTDFFAQIISNKIKLRKDVISSLGRLVLDTLRWNLNIETFKNIS